MRVTVKRRKFLFHFLLALLEWKYVNQGLQKTAANSPGKNTKNQYGIGRGGMNKSNFSTL